MAFPIEPPVEPMLCRAEAELPRGDGWLFEPKWDGFRAIVFRGAAEVFIQSRDLRPLDRYFPELHDVLLAQLPDGCVIDGEIVIATPRAVFDPRWLDVGIHPGGGHLWRLEQRVGRQAATALVLFGAKLTGDQAVRHGLAFACVEPDELMPQALAMARRAAARHAAGAHRHERA